VDDLTITFYFVEDPHLSRAEARLLKKFYREFANELEKELSKTSTDE